MPNRRVFSEQEVTDIITRATEISAEGGEEAYIPGVTIEELERIAKEVGVDPRALKQAIDDLRGGTKPRRQGMFIEEYVRVVDGELHTDDFDLVIEGVSLMNGKAGIGTTQIGRSLRATIWTGVSQAFLNIQSRGGRTKIEIKSNPWMQALFTLHPAFMAALITTGAMGERGMGLIGAAIGAGLLIVGGVAFNALRKLGHRRAEEVVDKVKVNIENLVEDRLSRPTTVQTQTDISEQQINLNS